MLDAKNAAMVEQAIPQGCRTRCGTCRLPIVEVPPPWPSEEPEWTHVDGWGGGTWHPATPVHPEPPAVSQHLVTHPSSLVDFLREWARFHGIRPVTTPEAYRAAERFAEALQQAIVPQVPTCSTCREPVQLVGVEPLLSTEHVGGSTDHKARIGGAR